MSPTVQDPDAARPVTRTPYAIWGLLTLLAGAIALVAYNNYVAQKRALEGEVQKNLVSVADIKVQQLAGWQSRRVRRARTIISNPIIQGAMQRAVSGRGDRRDVLGWMEALREELEASSVTLTDAHGGVVLSTGRLFGDLHHFRQAAQQAIAAGDVEISDLHRDPASGAIHIGMNLPLRAGAGAVPLGALLLAFDPHVDLYPLLDTWPVPSESAETLLVRRDGDDVLFLSDVRHRRDAALQLRLPMSRGDLPAVRAAAGEEGGMEGVDYRGVPVFAAVRRVPDTPWILVAKVDAAEVRAPLLQRSIMLGMLAVSLILAAGAAAAFLWRRQQLLYYRAQYEAAAERRALIGHYDYLTRFANDIILLVGPGGRIVEANDRAVAVYGYTRDELQRMTVRELRHPSDAEAYQNQFDEVAERGSLVFDTVHQNRDGRAMPVEVSTRLIDVGDKKFRQSIIRDISERKALDEKLQKALQTLRTVIESSPAAIVSVNRDLTITTFNPSAERLSGWKASEAIGQPFQIFGVNDDDLLHGLVEPVLASETVSNRPMVGRTKDGVPISLSVSAAPLQDAEGHVTGAVGILLDLTGREQAEAALAESESRFRATFEQAAVGMNHTSLEGRFLRVNQRYCEITGYSAEELLQLGFRDVSHPDELPANLSLQRELLDGRIPGFTLQKRYVRKNRSTVWVQVTVSLVRSPSGEPLYFSTVSEEITERLRAEDALRRSEERFRQVVENAQAGIVVESKGQIRYVNPAAQRLLGATTAEELVGRSLLQIVHPDELAPAKERSDLVNQGKISVPLAERRYQRLNGEPLPVEVSASPIEYDQHPAALVFFHDLTERKRAEAERNRLEEQLRQSQKMEGVGRLAGGVAHDFNNHLTVINGYCDMLLTDMQADDPFRQSVGEIRAAGERAAGLTQQLLAFSRKQMVSFQPLNLNEVVEDAGKMFRRLIGEDISLQIHLAAHLGPVMADCGQIHQVILNLVVNARDAMPHGGTLTIETADFKIGDLETSEDSARLYPEAQGVRYAVLSVSDTGIGMSPETIEKIFEPFYTTKARGAGTGLGLSTVYGIVQQSGGFIRVSSQPGQGSQFRIFIPGTDRAAEAPAPDLPDLDGVIKGSETILVVEDQRVVRKLAVSILQKCGYRLLEAPDGEEALLLAEQHGGSIDLLLTDVIMPGMTGKELADRVLSLCPRTKVLYVSGYTADVLGSHGVLDPGVAFLPKPFSPMGLSTKVREVLGSPKCSGSLLVIDDDDAVRAWLHHVLTGAGYEVLTAANGKDGIRLVHEQHVDVVITDLVMPEQEGLETVRLLRQQFPEIRIIAISGAFGGNFLKSACMLGAHLAILKPIDRDHLLASVHELLEPATPVA